MCKNFKKWLTKRFARNELPDTVDCSVSDDVRGFIRGLIKYSETTQLYRKYKDEIWEMLSDDAENLGESVLKMIAHFPSAKGVNNADQFERLLVWYAAEKIAYELTEGEYCEKDRQLSLKS